MGLYLFFNNSESKLPVPLDFFDFPFSVCNLNTMTCETVPYLIIFAGTNSDVP